MTTEQTMKPMLKELSNQEQELVSGGSPTKAGVCDKAESKILVFGQIYDYRELPNIKASTPKIYGAAKRLVKFCDS